MSDACEALNVIVRSRRANGAHRRASALLAAVSICAASVFGWGLTESHDAAAASGGSGFTETRTLTRDHLINGHNDVVDKRTVTVHADVTTNLRDRQGVSITWSGAHPTGGIVYDSNSQYAGNQEYPVVVLQCRGVDSTRVAASKRVSPETCFTQTPEQRYQASYNDPFPSYRLDRYATPHDRAADVGGPNPVPSSCVTGLATHWVPFQATDGTKYYGGYQGCAGLAPEQSAVADPLNPSNSTYASTAADGTGSARFIVQDAQSNASLGCSSTVPCSLVVIPIMGISCDATAARLPAIDRPSDPDAAQQSCGETGFYQAGTPGIQGSDDPNAEKTVSGMLWWSASNWRNRISIPITLADTGASCEVTGGGAPTNIYGSQYMAQATQQWAPTFCRDPKLFRLQQTQTSEVEAKNLLATGVVNGKYLGVKAAFQAGPPQVAFSNPIVQAPTAVSGFAIGYVMDDAKYHQFTKLKLDARLLAKLLTMSYPALPAIKSDWATLMVTKKVGKKTVTTFSKYKVAENNPLDMGVDPEFLALNPGMKTPYINQEEASSTLFAMSSNSDVMTALTSYINADPEARAWLNGKPDPWGMVVNPSYKKIKLPVTAWPLLDTYYNPLGNECISDGHFPYLPLVAGPVSDPAQITFNLQYGVSNSQTNCIVTGPTDSVGNRRLTASGREQPGIRFLLGIVSLADAQRYQITTAALQTQSSVKDDSAFTSSAGRSFASPTNAGLLAAAKMLKPDDALGTWPIPYGRLRTEPAGKTAYPGTLLMSTDVPTAGLLPIDARNYSKFLDYVAGPGQVAGTGNGQLAAGYLPITKADGLGALVDYTADSAVAVADQRGFVPKASAPSTGRTASTPPSTPVSTPPASTPPTSQPATTGQPLPTGGEPTTPVTVNAGTGASTKTSSAKPSHSASSNPSASSSTSPEPVLAAGPATPGARPNWMGATLPGLAVIALVSALAAAWTSGIGRRR